MTSTRRAGESPGSARQDADGLRSWQVRPNEYNAISSAEVAQLVERNLAKVEVAGSSPVFRSKRVVYPGPGHRPVADRAARCVRLGVAACASNPGSCSRNALRGSVRMQPAQPNDTIQTGDVAEWFRRGSAKPVTAVRFRPSPRLGLRRVCGRCSHSNGVEVHSSRRAVSSGGERFLDAEEVRGSNPLRPT